MQFETLFRAAREKPVTAALIGAGEFGLSLIAQSRRMQGLKISLCGQGSGARQLGVEGHGRRRPALR